LLRETLKAETTETQKSEVACGRVKLRHVAEESGERMTMQV